MKKTGGMEIIVQNPPYIILNVSYSSRHFNNQKFGMLQTLPNLVKISFFDLPIQVRAA